MKLWTIAIALILPFGSLANAQTPTPQQTMHVSSIHKATDAEKAYKTSFGMQFIETTIGNMHYTLSSLTGWAAGCNLEVGKDYDVVKANQQQVDILCVDAKGKRKPYKVSFNVSTVAEVGSAK